MNVLVLLASRFYRYLKGAEMAIKYKAIKEKYEIDETFKFNGEGILMYGDGKIKIGKNSYIGSYSTIQCSKSSKVVIGDNCSISHNVRIYSVSNLADQDFNSESMKTKKSGDVIIGNGVWIGANVFINPGIIIGSNVVIGANSVVTKNIEDNTIVGGVPAKIIRKIS